MYLHIPFLFYNTNTWLIHGHKDSSPNLKTDFTGWRPAKSDLRHYGIRLKQEYSTIFLDETWSTYKGILLL